jgi:uncharacterized protein YyaL (SSP411 family)
MPNPRLADAASLYLRQHADDPVEWYPWGEEAFARARALDRPVFLSSGYSACHFCHVMQRESFRDPDTSALINERFVTVKVDRELRPDVDSLYMDYVVATTGNGGWPMSVFLSPELAPLLGGTYFPRDASGPLPSLTEVLHVVDEAYTTGGEDMRTAAEGSLRFLREQAAPKPAGDMDASMIDRSAEYLIRLIDPKFGGFGTAVKFPEAPLLLFLGAYWRLNPDVEVRFAIEKTTVSIVRGGIYDQAGGGMFRYAVGRDWRVPHFEKMLYDQALLLSALAAAAPIVSDDALAAEFRHVARQTVEFLRRDMASPDGGFIASLAADAGGIEGGAYLWTREQLRSALAPPAYDVATRELGADAEDEPFTLTRAHGRAGESGIVDGVLDAIRAERERRPRPERDPKVVTSWNALTARGLMEAGTRFGDPAMASLGLATLMSVMEHALTPEGLVHVPGDASVAGVRLLEDSAHVTAACLSALDVTGDPVWLERAVDMHADTLERFAVDDVLYMTSAETELPVRPREQSDQPMPSGAATAIDNAVRLAEATGEGGYLEYATTALKRFWAITDVAPEHAGRALEAAVRIALLEKRS